MHTPYTVIYLRKKTKKSHFNIVDNNRLLFFSSAVGFIPLDEVFFFLTERPTRTKNALRLL